ncbi:tRNA lysidine(34) synthetase TilS [Candidatus Poribacteria bacterium]|nr:tRNA lysidine(34) synthetase TilS [Candidatus Poribacteria bacterium]
MMDGLGVPTPDSLVAAGVSGGADSTWLALHLHEEAARGGWRLHLVHVHHHQRGEEADADAAFVRELGDKLGVPCFVLDVTPSLLAGGDPGDSLEARLRTARLALLRAHAEAFGASTIALGHHADDLAESFLLMALRGSGPAGLGSMREVRILEPSGTLLWRPLLSMTRKEIEESLRSRGQTWRTDATNADPAFRRNRIRAEVLPLLREIEPGAVDVLGRAAGLCGEEADLLDLEGGQIAMWTVVSGAPGSMLVSAPALRSLPHGLAAAALRWLWGRLSGADGMRLPPSRAVLHDLLRRLESSGGAGSRIGPSQGIMACMDNQYVLLCPETADPAEVLASHMEGRARAVFLSPDSGALAVLNSAQRATVGAYSVAIPGGQGALAIEVLPAGGVSPAWDRPEWTEHRSIAFDPKAIRRDLVLRVCGPDETMPIGARESKTVAEVLREAHVPAVLRPRVAALCDDRGPLWIPGIRRAVSAYLTPRSELAVLIHWRTDRPSTHHHDTG